MNKEVLPLIGFIAVALIIVLLIVLYFYGFDVTEFFKNIAPIFYYR